MKRRTLLGLVATLSGTTVVGTSAFSSARLTRSVSVEVVGDGSALLQLEPCHDTSETEGLAPSDFVEDTGGTIAIDLTGDNENIEDGKGKGITESSLWRIPKAFRITNAGSQAVCVDLQLVDSDGEPPKVGLDGDEEVTVDLDGDGDDERTITSEDPAVVFYSGIDDSPDNRLGWDELNPGQPDAIHLEPSDSECIGFNIRKFGLSSDSDQLEGLTLRIKADANAGCIEDDQGTDKKPTDSPDSCPVNLGIDFSEVSDDGYDEYENDDGYEIASGSDDLIKIGQRIDEASSIKIGSEDNSADIKIENGVTANGGNAVEVSPDEDGHETIEIGSGNNGAIQTNGDGGHITIGSSDGTIKIGGDIDGDEIEISSENEGSDTSNIRISGNIQGTSIHISGVTIGGSISLPGGGSGRGAVDGNIEIEGSTVCGSVENNGNGNISITSSDVGGDIETAGGDAEVEIEDSSVFGSVEFNSGSAHIKNSQIDGNVDYSDGEAEIDDESEISGKLSQHD